MFYDILQRLCQKKNTTPTALVKMLGLSTSKVTAWKNGAIPKGDILARIADYLGVSTDYLLGRTDTPVSETAPTHTIVIPARNGRTVYRQLTPEQWEKYNKLIEIAMPEILDDSDEDF